MESKLRQRIEEAADKFINTIGFHTYNPNINRRDGFIAGALFGARLVVEFAEKYQLGTPIKLPHPMVEIETLKKLIKELADE